jgi:uncharacterized protein
VLPVWLQTTTDGVIVSVHAQPGAKRPEVAGVHGDALKIRIAAAPVEGKANDALMAYLAGKLGVPRKSVMLVSGETARRKRLHIVGVDAESVAEKLGMAGAQAAG